MLLRDRTAIVTGASSGIGRGVAIELAREGANVVAADIQEAPKQGKFHDQDVTTPTAEECAILGAKSFFCETDTSSEADMSSLIEEAVETYGGLDILVSNAGIHIPGTSQELSVPEWDLVMGINLRGIFLGTKFAVPHLVKSEAGRIINIASVHAFHGGAGPAYAPAKAAVVNLTKDTACEVGEHGVTVNAICPGYIETPIQDYLTEEDIQGCKDKTPLPRLGVPKDIGRACVFLASDDAEWITGVALPVDGGWLAPIW
ncbi:MAG: glucose 1-dehydrogenase [Candidatus Latescibacterota bacterium]|nr:glucose 1-dehydrogenase [Candidatus Latescibacterota bacterium]